MNRNSRPSIETAKNGNLYVETSEGKLNVGDTYTWQTEITEQNGRGRRSRAVVGICHHTFTVTGIGDRFQIVDEDDKAADEFGYVSLCRYYGESAVTEVRN